MKVIGGLIVIILIVVAGAFALGLIQVEKTQDGQLPKIAVEEGALPSYKADVARIEVGTRNETVEVPNVDVKKP